MHPAHRKRLEIEDATAELTECALPLCTSPPIYDSARGNLGVCHGHAVAIAIHYDRLDEEAPEITEARIQRAFRSRQETERWDREATSRAISPGWCYYIQVDDRIKVGYSKDVRERMRSYPPHAVLLAVHPGTLTLEAELHRQFKEYRAAGREWYLRTPDILKHIDSVVAEFGLPDPCHVYTFRKPAQQQMKVHRSSRRVGSGQRR